MDIIKDVFIEVVVRFRGLLKEFSFGFVKGLKIHLDVIIEIFNKLKEHCLAK